MRQWGHAARLEEINLRLRGKGQGDRRWYVNCQGQAFVIVDGPVEFLMGSPADEPDRDPDETAHRRRIPRRFAIADKEVSVEQYQEFLKQNPGVRRAVVGRYSPERTGPVNDVTWYEAAAYCNWLSRQETLPECYEWNRADASAKGLQIRADALTRHRLPAAHRGGVGVFVSRGDSDQPVLWSFHRVAPEVCLVPGEQRGSGLALRKSAAQRARALRHAGQRVRVVSGPVRALPAR